MTALRADLIRQEISNLLLQCPELQDDEQLRADMIEGETNALDFVRTIERRRKETSRLIESLDQYVADLKDRAERLSHRERGYRNVLLSIMETANLPRVELPEATISIRNGSPKVIITDETVLPDSMCRFTRTPDKKKIKEALALGLPMQGAILSNPERTVTIRIK